MNKFIGLVVLGCACVVGFGSIAGCPKPTKKTETSVSSGAEKKESPRETPKESIQSSKETAKESAKGTVRITVKESPKESHKETPKGMKSTEVKSSKESSSLEIRRPDVAMNAVLNNRLILS